MQLTESKLIKIIKEELQKVIIEQEMLQEESPREAMARIKREAGGFKALMALPSSNKLRQDFRKAFAARKAGKKTVNLGRPVSGADLASLETPEAGLGRKPM